MLLLLLLLLCFDSLLLRAGFTRSMAVARDMASNVETGAAIVCVRVRVNNKQRRLGLITELGFALLC
jgi:hypothetical protein